MAKLFTKPDEKEKAQTQAEHVAKTIDEQANRAEADALAKSKSVAIASGQAWEQAEHANPFQTVMVAQVKDVRTNGKGDVYVRFSYAPKGNAPSLTFEAVTEKEFRERFPKLAE